MYLTPVHGKLTDFLLYELDDDTRGLDISKALTCSVANSINSSYVGISFDENITLDAFFETEFFRH